jgi:hypothetical protein
MHILYYVTPRMTIGAPDGGKPYFWLYPYYIADRLGPSDCEWIVPGTVDC